MNSQVGDREVAGRHRSSAVGIADRSATNSHTEQVLVRRNIEQQEVGRRTDDLRHVAVDHPQTLLVLLLGDLEAAASPFLFSGLRRSPFGRHLPVEGESILLDLRGANIRIAMALSRRSRFTWGSVPAAKGNVG